MKKKPVGRPKLGAERGRVLVRVTRFIYQDQLDAMGRIWNMYQRIPNVDKRLGESSHIIREALDRHLELGYYKPRRKNNGGNIPPLF